MDRENRQSTSSTSSSGSVRQQQLFQLLISNTSNLEKNWKINLDKLLREYMTEIGVSHTTEEDIIHLNFAEIGLVLQNSVQIYAKKIKLLEKEVLGLQLSLTYNAIQREKELEERLSKENPNPNEPLVEENNNVIQPVETVQPEEPPQKKKKREEKPPPESTTDLIDAVINANQEQSSTNIMDILVPLLKKLTAPIQKRLLIESELEEEDLQSSLPIFTSVTIENRQICSEILLSLLNEPYSLPEVFRRFLTTNYSDQSRDFFAQIEEKRMLICKVMLLLEIRNKLKCNWRNDEDRLRIIEFLKPCFPPLTSVFDTPRSLPDDDDLDFTFQDDLITSTPHSCKLKELSVSLKKLSDEEISFHTNKCKRKASQIPDSKSVVKKLIESFEDDTSEEGNFDELLNELNENPFSSTNSIVIMRCKINNFFLLPKRLLKSTKSFKLPAELIMEEKLKRRSRMLKPKKPNEPLKIEPQNIVIKEEVFGDDVNGSFDCAIRLDPLDSANSQTEVIEDTQENAMLTQDSGIADVDSFEQSTIEVDAANNSSLSVDSAICNEEVNATKDHINNLFANWDDSPEGDVLNKVVKVFKDQTEQEQQKLEMLGRVKEWKEYITPKLTNSEERNYFNIHEYEDKILDNFPINGNKATINFQKIVEKQSGKEVSRYFSAVLQMANNNVVKITKLKDTKVGDTTVDAFEVTNLSPIQNYESPAENIDSMISSIITNRKRPFKC